MRLLHTSDWHLGRVLYEQSLLEEQARMLDALLDYLASDPCDALIIAGDVFDRTVPSEEAVALWDTFLNRYGQVCPTQPLLVIAGNHDSATRLSMGASVLARAHVHVRGGVEGIETPVTLEDRAGNVADVWMIPFLWGGAIQRECQPLHTQEAALAEAVARIEARLCPDRLNVLVAHCFAAGSEVSDSERTLVGTAVQVEAGLFAAFDYVALGHLHRPQQVTPRVRYSGTPLAYSFSEAGQAKSFTLATLEKGALPGIETRPVQPQRPLVNLKGTLEELLTDPRHAGHAEHFVRAVLTEPAGLGQPMARLRQRFPFVLDFQEPEVAVTSEDGPDLGHEREDLQEDFFSFERALRGADGAPESVVAAFETLRQDLEREDAR